MAPRYAGRQAGAAVRTRFESGRKNAPQGDPMRHARRFALAVVALAMLFTSSLARAQVLQNVPTDAWW